MVCPSEGDIPTNVIYYCTSYHTENILTNFFKYQAVKMSETLALVYSNNHSQYINTLSYC